MDKALLCLHKHMRDKWPGKIIICAGMIPSYYRQYFSKTDIKFIVIPSFINTITVLHQKNNSTTPIEQQAFTTVLLIALHMEPGDIVTFFKGQESVEWMQRNMELAAPILKKYAPYLPVRNIFYYGLLGPNKTFDDFQKAGKDNMRTSLSITNAGEHHSFPSMKYTVDTGLRKVMIRNKLTPVLITEEQANQRSCRAARKEHGIGRSYRLYSRQSLAEFNMASKSTVEFTQGANLEQFVLYLLKNVGIPSEPTTFRWNEGCNTQIWLEPLSELIALGCVTRHSSVQRTRFPTNFYVNPTWISEAKSASLCHSTSFFITELGQSVCSMLRFTVHEAILILNNKNNPSVLAQLLWVISLKRVCDNHFNNSNCSFWENKAFMNHKSIFRDKFSGDINTFLNIVHTYQNLKLKMPKNSNDFLKSIELWCSNNHLKYDFWILVITEYDNLKTDLGIDYSCLPIVPEGKDLFQCDYSRDDVLKELMIVYYRKIYQHITGNTYESFHDSTDGLLISESISFSKPHLCVLHSFTTTHKTQLNLSFTIHSDWWPLLIRSSKGYFTMEQTNSDYIEADG
eukprot:Lithocolla_globosa_v1_NODE_761_length_3323_cov_18.520808.p1 type:complete len:569 gc:universal NODE_761_length_3323_cov_18.520808:616-2322(+)